MHQLHGESTSNQRHLYTPPGCHSEHRKESERETNSLNLIKCAQRLRNPQRHTHTHTQKKIIT